MRAAIVVVCTVSACSFRVDAPASASDAGGTGDVGDVGDAGDAITNDAEPPDASSPPTWVVIDTLVVPVNGLTVLSTVSLQSGVGYRLRASGTFVIQSPLGTQGDAEWWDFTNLMDGVVGVDVGIAVNDTLVDATRTPDWGPYAPTHVYEIAWTGDGQQIVAQLHDGNFSNNTGSLTLEILALP